MKHLLWDTYAAKHDVNECKEAIELTIHRTVNTKKLYL